MDYRQDQQSAQLTTASPHLVAANRMLEMATLDFQALVTAETEENPALEVEERISCGRCGCPTVNGVCLICEYLGGTMELMRKAQEGSLASAGDEIRTATVPDDDDFDLMESAASILAEADRLTATLQAVVPEKSWPIIDYLVGNLDGDGRLGCTVRDAAEALMMPVSDVVEVLRELQRQDPPGIGARDVRECLLIQLGQIEEHDGPQPLARALIRDHLEDLYARRYAHIASALGVSAAEVLSGLDHIGRNLNPYPGRIFSGERDPLGAVARPAVPDVVVARREGDDASDSPFEVSALDNERYSMTITKSYHREYERIRNKISELSEAEQQHIVHYWTRARQFIRQWGLRGTTLTRIISYVVDYQAAFVGGATADLKPLTRSEVATFLGLHESTISRAVADKHVLLPDGRLVALRDFFSANLATKSKIMRIIADEERPLTDQEIVECLEQDGIHVSRRVVAKYRQQLDIASSPHRSSSQHAKRPHEPETSPTSPVKGPGARPARSHQPRADSAAGRAGD